MDVETLRLFRLACGNQHFLPPMEPVGQKPDAPPFFGNFGAKALRAFAETAVNSQKRKPAPEDRRGFQMNNRLSAP
jgi:hypothetical protein